MRNINRWLQYFLLGIFLGGSAIAANTFFHEPIGIGTSTPQAMLDVAGGMKISDDSDSCVTAKKGTLRFNTSTDKFEMCDGSSWTFIILEDGIPSSFTFTDKTDTAKSSLISSTAIAITGINISVTATITGDGTPNVRVCADSGCSSVVDDWGTSAVISNGQYLQARLTSASTDLTERTATISLAGLNDVWSVTTASTLYTFSSHEFTNCGQTGTTGPSLTQCRNAYTTNWDDVYLNMTTNGIQEWTVPQTGTYTIEAFGAQGGSGGGGSTSLTGGSGARMKGEFGLTKGDVIKILVGQAGGSDGGAHGNENGGGGGTFVVQSNNTPLIIAGGGGGGPATGYGTGCTRDINDGHGQTTTSGVTITCSGTGTGGSSGSGGSTAGSYQGGGGGGLTGNGANGTTHCAMSYGGQSFTNGAVGGTGNSCYTSDNFGGFGGGGGGQLGGPGAGGGYSGGGSSASWSGNSTYGGGGGSYNAGSNQDNSAGDNTGHGKVIITLGGGAPAVCGDGEIQSPETCDDGNTTAGDGCSDVCIIEPICGNSTIESPEECDDGNTTAGDGCSDTCTLELAAEGEACSVDADCQNNSCIGLYTDGDGDGYGIGSSTWKCYTSPPAGYVTDGSDCCDSDSNSHPGAGYETSQNNCGSWDIDCSGSVEKRGLVDHACLNLVLNSDVYRIVDSVCTRVGGGFQCAPGDTATVDCSAQACGYTWGSGGHYDTLEYSDSGCTNQVYDSFSSSAKSCGCR